MERLTRRQILQLLSISAVAAGCGAGSEDNTEASTSDIGAEEADALTSSEVHMLNQIDHFVIVMMENRSFDHYFGALQRDKDYPNHKTVSGSSADDFNWDTGDKKKIFIHNASRYDKPYQLASPPHSWEAAHDQWGTAGHRNDDFVKTYTKLSGAKNAPETMAYYTRKEIPFYYHMADNYALFDQWHASVMGPTIPNRLYLNTGTSANSKNNDPIVKDEPETIWDQLRAKKVSAKLYHDGKASLMMKHLPKKANAGDIPFAPFSDFTKHVGKNQLPSVSYIEPDYSKNCDHPVHDIRLGQAFVQGIYKTLRGSKLWAKTLMVVMYDEHGGFWDHVSPPAAHDADADFRRFGFRVPAFAAGGLVRRSYLANTLHDHTSVLATLAQRFDLPAITRRARFASTLAHVLDPDLLKKNAVDTTPEPEPVVLDADALETIGAPGQPELDEAIASGEIPAKLVDQRTLEQSTRDWLIDLQNVGAVRFAP